MSICDFILCTSVGFGVLLHDLTLHYIFSSLAISAPARAVVFNLLADHLPAPVQPG